MRQYRDIYRGFEISYDPEHSGYRVYQLGMDILCFECSSYEDACAWIDAQHKRNGLELGLRLA